MKKNWKNFPFNKGKRLKLFKILRLYALIMALFLPYANAGIIEQNMKFNVDYKNVTLQSILKDLQNKTQLSYLYCHDDIADFKDISFKIKNATIKQILDKALKNTNLKYKINTNLVVIKKDKVKKDKKDKREIKGRVVDENNLPIPGVSVVLQGTAIGTATDANGKYKILASSRDALTFSFIGYKTKIVLVENKTKIDVKLYSKSEKLNEVVVNGVGTTGKKDSKVASIQTINTDLLKSSNSDLTSMFVGTIAGLGGFKTNGLPAALTESEMSNKFYIRGITSYQSGANTDPLILLDGIEVSKLDLARIDPDDIENFSVMKDASATAMYGARGANGVIFVTTKKGKAGNVRTSFRYERIWSMPTKNIDIVGGKDYMKLFNEAIVERNPGAIPKYTQDRIDKTDDPKYPSWVYPNNDWYDKLFNDYSINNHYSLNVRGGSEKIQYYVSVNHNNDKGMIKSDPLNDFDCNIENKQTNFRTNINVDLNKSAKLTLNSFSTYDNYHGPGVDVQGAYYLALNASPVDFAPTYPADADHAWPHILYGGAFSTSQNPYAAIQTEYKDRVRFSTINKFEYIQKLNKLIQGLELRASIGLTKTGYFANAYRMSGSFYTLDNYNPVTGEHKLISDDLNSTSDKLSYNEFLSERASTTTMDYQLKLIYARGFGPDRNKPIHELGVTTLFNARQTDNSVVKDLMGSFPQRNMGFSMSANYGYKGRYYIEGSFGLNGSERFANGNKIGFFPSIGGAWVVSKENFLRPCSNWLSYLKFRLSYGLTGNDGVINDPRFLYLQEIGRSTLKIGYPYLDRAYSYVNNYGNEETEWETSEQVNLGIELKLFHGLIESNIDIYQEIRHNIYDYRSTLPLTIGLFSLPLDNYGKVRSRGVDFSAKIQHAFSSNLWIIANGTFTYNKAEFKKVEEATDKREWQKKVGHDISQQYCYIAEGLFQDQQEIDNAPFQSGNVQPGDIRYRDIDDNGIIDVNDAVLAGYPEIPRITYGFNGVIHYKNLEFSFAFQGSGNRTFFINPEKISPFYSNRACLSAIAEDHWTSDNHKTKPFWPKLSTYNITEHNPQENYYLNGNSEVRKSTYFMRSCKFIRCTNLELSLYLNKDWLSKYRLQNFRFFARANNPFIISNFKLWDVELGENGFNYPIQKTYSIGCNFSF